MDRVCGVAALVSDGLGGCNAKLAGRGGEMTGQIGEGYLQPGTLDRPGPRGRLLRLLVGGLQATALVLALLNADIFLRPQEPFSVSLFVVIWLLFTLMINIRVLGDIVNVGFHVNWGNRPYWVLLGLTALTLALSLGFSGAIWAIPFSLLVFVFTLYTAGHLAISHILAAILATPGCEMRAIPQMIAILRGSELIEEHPCDTGPRNRIDKREAQRGSA